MEISYRQNYLIYLAVIALALAILLGWFKIITDFRLESTPFISVRNLVAFGLFYIVRQIYRRQVDYY